MEPFVRGRFAARFLLLDALVIDDLFRAPVSIRLLFMCLEYGLLGIAVRAHYSSYVVKNFSWHLLPFDV